MFEYLNPSISFLLSQNGVYPYGAPCNGTSKSSFISVRTIYIQFRTLGKKGKIATHVLCVICVCLAIPGLHQPILSFSHSKEEEHLRTKSCI